MIADAPDQTAPSLVEPCQDSVPHPPYPRRQLDVGRLEVLAGDLLDVLSPGWADDEGLAETPRRWARFWDEFLGSHPGRTTTTFETVETDQLVLLKGLDMWSLCRHHLLPFHCRISIGYAADDRILGLSKLARVAQDHARRLQVQERLVGGIRKDMTVLLGHDNVAVAAKGRHLCLDVRGVPNSGDIITSSLGGTFRTAGRHRAEFMAFLRTA